MLAQRLPGLLPPLVVGRIARSFDGAFGGGAAGARAIDAHASVSRAASFCVDGGAGRRRLARQAGRNLAGASGRAVPGRVAGIRAAGARCACASRWRTAGDDRARQSSRHLSGAHCAGGGDESVPLRRRAGRGACRRGPRCATEYQARLSGPLLDRIDIQLDVPPVTAADLSLPPPVEGTAEAAARVGRARAAQSARAAAGSTPISMLGRAGRRSPSRMRRARRCCRKPPKRCRSRRAPITAR